MLRSIFIRNFQSHKVSSLNLHKGINVVVGESQTGKTAIARGLLWVKNNRPLAFRFNHKKSNNPTEVEILLEEGFHIIKWKDKTDSEYIIESDDKTTTDLVFSGYGKEVPEEVVKVLNLSDINIQPQLDPHYLIRDTPAEIARELNRITKIEDVEKWRKKITKEINTTKGEIEYTRNEIDGYEKELTVYENLDSMEEKLKEIEKDTEVYIILCEDVKGITDLIDKMEKVEGVLNRSIRFTTVERKLDKLEKDQNKYLKICEDISYLRDYITIEKELEKYSVLKEAEKEYDLLLAKLTLLDDDIEDVEEMIHKIESNDDLLNSIEEDVKDCEDKLKKELVRLGKCPFCSTKLTDRKVENIVSNM